MTLPQLRAWAVADAQRDSLVALAVRSLLRDHDALRVRAGRMATEATARAALSADLEIALGHNAAYAAELARLRAELDTRTAEWERM